MRNGICKNSLDRNLTVYHGVFPHWKELKIKELIEDYRSNNPKSLRSNVIAWQSSMNAHVIEPRFNELVDVCAQFIYSAVGLKRFPNPMTLVDCWCMQYDVGNYAVEHCHWPLTFACTYYADVGEGSSPLRFSDSALYPDGFEIKPENGMIIAFDALTKHYVPPTDSPRSCVAMNYQVLPPKDSEPIHPKEES